MISYLFLLVMIKKKSSKSDLRTAKIMSSNNMKKKNMMSILRMKKKSFKCRISLVVFNKAKKFTSMKIKNKISLIKLQFFRIPLNKFMTFFTEKIKTNYNLMIKVDSIEKKNVGLLGNSTEYKW